jgi:hypothetical protein
MYKSTFELFFSNLFDVPRIIDSRLQVFTRNVIAAIYNSNPGNVFDAHVAALQASHDTYFGKSETKGVAKAERKGKTKSLDTITKEFADAVRSKYNFLASVFPEGTATYIEFLPTGLTEMSRLTRANILAISHRIATKATEYKAQLGGQAFADIFTGYHAAIEAAIKEQNKGKTKVKSLQSDVINSRQPVEDALMKLLFKVGDTYWPDAEKCQSYFDFSLLFAASSNDDDETPETGK